MLMKKTLLSIDLIQQMLQNGCQSLVVIGHKRNQRIAQQDRDHKGAKARVNIADCING